MALVYFITVFKLESLLIHSNVNDWRNLSPTFQMHVEKNWDFLHVLKCFVFGGFKPDPENRPLLLLYLAHCMGGSVSGSPLLSSSSQVWSPYKRESADKIRQLYISR